MKKTQSDSTPGIPQKSSTQQAREDFLEKRIKAGSIELHPLSVAILWLFEDLKHPFTEPLAEGEKRNVSVRDTARAIFIFHDPAKAEQLFRDGMAAFDAAAMELARGIPAEELSQIGLAVLGLFKGTVKEPAS